VSKKEIRRAARDAFPKARGASSAKRGRGGAYSKRTYQAKPRAAANSGARNVPKPPSIKRSLIMGAFAAVFYFVLIQWIIRIGDTSLRSNLVVAGVGLVLFAAVNYLSEGFRYRRYLRKKEGSGK
jgi:uncharacterized protein (DUF2062 family)